MNYIVMECHPGYAILLDEAGIFCKAANLNYEVGQTVKDPVLMKSAPEKAKARSSKWLRSGIAAVICRGRKRAAVRLVLRQMDGEAADFSGDINKGQLSIFIF